MNNEAGLINCKAANVAYHLKRMRRKSYAIKVMPGGKVLVSAPLRASLASVDAIVARRADWIIKKQSQLRDKLRLAPYQASPSQRQTHHQFLAQRLLFWAELFPASRRFNLKIKTRVMKGRWGSCSSLGVITLNLQLVHIKSECMDYVICHELAHLAEANHSKKFYEHLASVMEDWRQWNDELKRYLLA